MSECSTQIWQPEILATIDTFRQDEAVKSNYRKSPALLDLDDFTIKKILMFLKTEDDDFEFSG